MKGTLVYKILKDHLIEGDLEIGKEIAIKLNQTLTQDSTGTMVYLQLEAMGIDKIKTDLSVAYIDHNTIQAGFENADDHEFIRTAARKYGLVYSKPGGGICHQVQLERFAKPGITLIGSDSHTPTAGGLGALAIGAGGLDVAVGMANGYYYITVPKVYNVKLTGKLSDKCNGKDVILTVLQKLSVKGGVGYIMEYTGPGVKSLSVTDRATICNMGAELGATTSIFPSDENTLDFLTKQNRPEDYIELSPDEEAEYENTLEINLDDIVPMAAKPHSPDNVIKVDDEKIKVDQVAIGSCTNSSYADMMKVAKILDGNKVDPSVSLVIAPGSSNILRLLSENGALKIFIEAGARILESACGPCIGMGQAPKSKGVSLRTFNRNFKGRSGTMDAEVYLVSPETAAASAITGYLTNPNTLDLDLTIEEPGNYGKSDNYFIFPNEEDLGKDVVMGPNIKPFPKAVPLSDTINKKVILKTGDNITTDDICPSNAKLLPFRSNIPYLSQFSFKTIVDDFYDRAVNNDGGIIVGGDNYGQGSSREHAALVPLFLGVKAVIAKSFARIHRSNLINSGILPLVFVNKDDYEKIDEYDELELNNTIEAVTNGKVINLINKTKNIEIPVIFEGSPREIEVVLNGGFLNYAKNNKLEV
ncbi:aconitate hydratase [Miniphocaeibacter halophilus]|uniref:Aconitate hydratase n=1 Tax=Miniphocaeibacter halophilus TaxID=2931922 RepID=A0AC61MPB7_9FIRM|nr:aconitate hydratase [Miniphocaeibacter halophilus]QQK07370.1 aconitate hydratase [Miniphocaeibacter halophilus]